MTNTYLSFITDEDIFNAIQQVYDSYSKVYAEFNYSKFTSNIIDPFQMLFDTKFAGTNVNTWIDQEVNRQIGKSLTNERGMFHEIIAGCAPNFKRYAVGEVGSWGVDCINDKKTVFADIKNKHNTLNSNSVKGLWEKFSHILEAYPNATCYHVQIIAKSSYNKPWDVPVGDVTPQIRLISADLFYDMIFHETNTFKRLTDVLPDAITDFMEQHNHPAVANLGSMALYGELAEKAKAYGTGSDYLKTIENESFHDYRGFK